MEPVKTIELTVEGEMADAFRQAQASAEEILAEEKYPVKGIPATVTIWTDSYACTVESISASGKTITLRRDKAILLNGCNSDEADKLEFSPGGFCGHVSGTQRYSYERDPNGEVFKATLRTRRNGSQLYKLVGTGTYSQGGYVTLGSRHEHRDFNF